MNDKATYVQRLSVAHALTCMKHLLTRLFCLIATAPAFSQYDKPVTFSATARFNAVVNGLASNDAGYGVGVDLAFFSQHRVQLLVESSWDRFIGDKLRITDPATEKEAKRTTVYALSIGPQVFLSRRVAVAATYGPAWHVLRDFHYSLDDGFKVSLMGIAGDRDRLVAKLFGIAVPTRERSIQYVGLAVGLRL